MRTPPKLDQATLLDKFTYKDGELYRNGIKVQGNVNVGYHQYPKESVIYAMHNNTPFERIDHIDGNTSNNYIENLTPISEQEYQDNRIAGKYYEGVRDGVHWDRYTQTYTAVKDGKLLGRFKHGDQAQQEIDKWN